MVARFQFLDHCYHYSSKRSINIFYSISRLFYISIYVWEWGERERVPGNERSEIKAGSLSWCFRTRLAHLHFTTHTWDSKESHGTLPGYHFPEDENQWRDFWERLEVSWSSCIEGELPRPLYWLAIFLCWNENTTLVWVTTQLYETCIIF